MNRSDLPFVWDRNGLVRLSPGPMSEIAALERPRVDVVSGVVGHHPLDPGHLDDEPGGGVARERRPSLSFDQKQAVIAAVLDHITIGPGSAGPRPVRSFAGR